MDDKTRHGFLIDPGAEAGRLLSLIRREGWVIEAILLTHGHFDHTGAVNELRDVLGTPVYAHEDADRYLLNPRMNLSAFCVGNWTMKNVEYLREGDIISLDANSDFSLRVIHTPGHTTDSVVYYSEKDRVAFVGDTIFKGSIGNYQYPGGDRQDIAESIIGKIFTLPDDTVLYSGHSEETSVGIEKRRYR
ncbi:MAG: MBL fold metallo-hydrolase [Oscillospiraceae bacterium]|nr:MBL fold metallo-hydrolase [Oscillospiraceae bacterium]